MDSRSIAEDHESLQVKLESALARETATREILEIISQSRTDEAPVFQAILERAERLCDATGSGLQLMNKAGTHLRYLATGSGEDKGSFPLGTEFDLNVPLGMCIAVNEGRVVHYEDLRETELYKQGQEGRRKLVDVEGVLTQLNVPLMRDGVAFGNIFLSRTEQKGFSPDEIALVETFAAQAVIAIENVRQFRELQTRLEREAALRDILHVINRSRDDEIPVFESILDRAARLCDAQAAGLQMLNETGSRIRLVCNWGDTHGVIEPGWTLDVDSPMDLAVAIREARVINITDLKETDLYRQGHAGRVQLVDGEGVRSWLIVPLQRDGIAYGSMTLSRHEVKPFSPDEIALLETFAAQAVIALENVRQFHELQTRFEREAATKDVLHVISRSRADEIPVFDTILANAARLCRSPMAMLLLTNDEQTRMFLAASFGQRLRLLSHGDDWEMEPDFPVVKAIRSGRAIQTDDLAASEFYLKGHPTTVSLVEGEGLRTRLSVPLVKDGHGIGCIILCRREVAPFTEADIELVETFASQAVIAIENVRQFKALETLNNELSDRVEKQVGEIERMGRLKRFLPAAVADKVVTQGSEDLLASHRALLGVLFCDIRGFTAFCETAEPEETIEVLQTYHEEMGALIAAHGAGVDSRAGDGIMVLFNDPLPCEDPAGDALRLALAMRARMEELCKSWRRHGHKLGFGVGVSLGYATVGMVGSEGRYDYTASGTAINLAARLCDQADDGEILLSPRAYAAVDEAFAADAIGEVSLKGIHAPVEVFRVSGVK